MATAGDERKAAGDSPAAEVKTLAPGAKQATFEQSLAELEEIVAQLEAGEKPLDESLTLYEKGVAALKRCHAILDTAEKRIRTLVKDADGEVSLRDAPPQGATEEPAAAAADEPAEGGTETRGARKRAGRPGGDGKAVPRRNAGPATASDGQPEDNSAAAGGSLFGGSR